MGSCSSAKSYRVDESYISETNRTEFKYLKLRVAEFDNSKTQ